MNILMTGDTIGGVWTYALDLARALGPGAAVHLATMGAPLSPQQRAEARALSNLKVHESRFRLEWMPDSWADVDAAGEWLLDLEEQVRPDVVHLNGYAHGALPWRSPRLIVAHSCVLSWWRAVKRQAAPAEWNCYRQRVTAGLRACDLIVAPTRSMLDDLRSLYACDAAESQVIPNGRHRDLFRIGSKEPFLFSAGRLWDEAKNIGALAEVSAELAWPAFVAGDAARPGGGACAFPNVTLLGRLGLLEVAEWMSRAAIYVLPAKYEPFGLSALEAALSGCALVLGDIPSLREVWGDAAIFVPPDDLGALREAIDGLISDGGLRCRMALMAAERARDYSPRRMADGYLDAYSCLTRHASRRKMMCASYA
jgi:glycosyltransferase involved in cell wall biosynthesis